MGCNYYAKIKLTDELETQLIEAVKNHDFEKIKMLMPTNIHIGKSSIGWQFLFNHNNWKYFDENIESLRYFLLNSEIKDEYDEVMPSEKFLAMVELQKRFKPNLKYNGEKTGEMLFGLNFSTSTDFS